MSGLELYTASYRSFIPGAGIPVQASNSRPRWSLPYRLEHRAPSITPPAKIVFDKSISDAQFDVLYRQYLDQIGVEAIERELAAIAESASSKTLVLMCFEADRAKCHRGTFSDWWWALTGEPVAELRTGEA